MLARRILPTLLGLGIAAAVSTGWLWGWHERAALERTSAFDRQRLAFFEAENGRLRAALLAREQQDDASATGAQRSAIERTVGQLRSLDFLHPVVYKQIPRSDLPALLRQKLAQQVPDQELTSDGIALAALGLLPAGLDLKTTYLDLLGEQIGAFYDQHTQELFTFSGQSLANAQNRVILAHELTHALEDQHFSLARLPLEAQHNDDRVLAATALVEGDATLVMNQFMLGEMSAAVLRDTLSSALTTDVRKLGAAPRFLRETLLFPYLRGQEFCQALYLDGGWDALADAFRHPPSSTAEILHPALFMARPRVPPVVIEFPQTAVLGQQPLADNVLGEFGLRQLFARWLPVATAGDDAAAGWRGDRYLVYGNAQATAYVWRIACADAAAAAKLGAALHATLAARCHLAESVSGASRGEIFSVELAERRIGLWRVGPVDILVIDAPDARWNQALRAQFAPG
jgi:hypothetical protein